MMSYLQSYQGPYDVIDEVMDGKKTAVYAARLLQGWSHFVPYTKDDMDAFGSGRSVRITTCSPTTMPPMAALAHVVKKTLTGKINSAATVKNWFEQMPDTQIAGQLSSSAEGGCRDCGRTVFAGSVMPAQMAMDLLQTCSVTLDLAMTPNQLRDQLTGRKLMQELAGIRKPCAIEQVPVVLTSLRLTETSNEVALHAVPLRPGACVVNDEGLVHYVYGAHGGIFFEKRGGYLTVSPVIGWPEEYQLRAGCESHAELFAKRGLTTSGDRSVRRSLFTLES